MVSEKCVAISRGVALVLGIAVARQDRGDDMLGRGQLRQPRDDGGIDAAAEADDESPRAGGRQFAAASSR